MTVTTLQHIRQRVASTCAQLPSGWWLIPGAVFGAAGWVGLAKIVGFL